MKLGTFDFELSSQRYCLCLKMCVCVRVFFPLCYCLLDRINIVCCQQIENYSTNTRSKISEMRNKEKSLDFDSNIRINFDEFFSPIKYALTFFVFLFFPIFELRTYPRNYILFEINFFNSNKIITFRKFYVEKKKIVIANLV